MRNQRVHEDNISRLFALLGYLIFNGRTKTKLAMLAFLYCGEFVKNSNVAQLYLHFISNVPKNGLTLWNIQGNPLTIDQDID